MSVSVNPPKTPVTAGSNGVAAATVPNVCKMPGPPAPFVPTPLPNIGKSSDSPKGYSKQVTIAGKKVAIKGASFGSTGDMASKATGGGVVSNNTHGPTKFVGPGSMDVKIEGKNVQLLSDPMLNNCGPSGTPANAATLLGVIQASGLVTAVEAGPCPICEKSHGDFAETEQTKVDAGGLAANFETQVRPIIIEMEAMTPKKPFPVSTMLGVVACKCGKKYADQSAATTVELCNAAKGMIHPANVTLSYRDAKPVKEKAYLDTLSDVEARMGKLLGKSSLFEKRWEEASQRSLESDKLRKAKVSGTAAAYPPGTCAAQKTLVLLLEDGALAAAMTERWYNSKGDKTQAPIKFVDGRVQPRQEIVDKFEHGTTVPPCGACELLVPLLLCDGGKLQCEHKT
ncbi:PAAR-like domain-containing protein [Nannocystis pusilla]|uniref:PAAR-like domain-containing protein n=1 Tax=Nannocystis pusilla TaxID=889268 RepID=UPI003BF0A4EA